MATIAFAPANTARARIYMYAIGLVRRDVIDYLLINVQVQEGAPLAEADYPSCSYRLRMMSFTGGRDVFDFRCSETNTIAHFAS